MEETSGERAHQSLTLQTVAAIGVTAPAVSQTVVVDSALSPLLVGKGYDVLTAADGEEALNIADTHVLDLLLTDMVMPKLSGKQLALQLRRVCPASLSSSCSATPTTPQPASSTDDAFVQKPFSPHELTTTIRTTLDSTRTPDEPPISTLTRLSMSHGRSAASPS